MRILYIADGRSPIALNWIAYFVEHGHEVHLASTFPCTSALKLASIYWIPVAFSRVKASDLGMRSSKGRNSRLWGASTVGLRTLFRQWFGPLTIYRAAETMREIILRINPDIVHAMRIPFEGVLASQAMRVYRRSPLLVSVWGNDFTLHAQASPLLAHQTRQTLSRTDALHTDCRRDLRLAWEWGLSREKPAVVLPGGGGVQLDIFYPPTEDQGKKIDETVINPRGIRSYVRNDIFFKSLPLVLAHHPKVKFLCPGMAGEPFAEGWLRRLGIDRAVELLPKVPREKMAELFRRSDVVVSPTTHDGTPNTLLEAMACGCFPIAGDLESIREWITPGLNGLLVDPQNANALAEAILLAIGRPDLRHQGLMENERLIAERADYRHVMARVEGFYRALID